MILLFGGVLASGEKAPMEAFCLKRDSSMDLNAFCDIELDENLVYSKLLFSENPEFRVYIHVSVLILTQPQCSRSAFTLNTYLQ